MKTTLKCSVFLAAILTLSLALSACGDAEAGPAGTPGAPGGAGLRVYDSDTVANDGKGNLIGYLAGFINADDMYVLLAVDNTVVGFSKSTGLCLNNPVSAIPPGNIRFTTTTMPATGDTPYLIGAAPAAGVYYKVATFASVLYFKYNSATTQSVTYPSGRYWLQVSDGTWQTGAATTATDTPLEWSNEADFIAWNNTRSEMVSALAADKTALGHSFTIVPPLKLSTTE